MPSGRKAVTGTTGVSPVDAVERQLEDLGRLADAGIPLHLLFNANCYGAKAQARSFFAEIGETIERFADGALTGVTTTSPLIAKFVKDNFPQLETRASVNMEIGTEEGMDYLADLFDGFYLKRELNRDLASVRRIKAWCDAHGKKLYILANSGCLNFCSSHVFHDNLVAHEAEIAREDNGYAYGGTCWTWLARPENRAKWMERTNWIAPEDVPKYEGLCTAMKLATRVNAHPVRILESYATGSHIGSVMSLLEPDHSALFAPRG
jgi:collagenase-like PrtC family protease